ncbi:GTP 3',8-cyclase [Propionicimonas sp. T2.31MG-18]|uniref:AmmeMemoRadiSam system radical SAM enzyme n=1 Tax=Propionicimonas sp. T2.31MG-18 TaxID=3157620 RepID=UPI0035ECEE6C
MATPRPARWWHALDDGRLQCDLCPQECKLRDGQRGACFVRRRDGSQLVLTTYGLASGFCVDPIEKKPLAHFYPGSSVLSFGTVGCNLACRYCQNWDISTSRDADRLQDAASPASIARAATQWGCRSVAFTYNDPVIFAEYAMDAADACHEEGLKTVAVTAGYVNPEPRREFFAHIDAANVDLKSFSEEFYARLTRSHLQPVLDTISYLVHETPVWVELTTLLIPGHNDTDDEVRRLSGWVAGELGPDVPLHFSAFHPSHHLMDVPPTPPSTLRRARRIAREEGLHHVYTGNVRDPDGETTWCPECGQALVRRDWYQILEYRLTADGRCPDCDAVIAGCFADAAGDFGHRRIPVHLAGG